MLFCQMGLLKLLLLALGLIMGYTGTGQLVGTGDSSLSLEFGEETGDSQAVWNI